MSVGDMIIGRSKFRGIEVTFYAFRRGEVGVSRGPDAEGELRWHLSVSAPDGYARPEEINAAIDRFLPPDLLLTYCRGGPLGVPVAHVAEVSEEQYASLRKRMAEEA